MRILFIGCVKSSEIFLKKLIDMKADVVGVVTKSESKFNSDFVNLAGICDDNNIKYMYAIKTNDEVTKVFVREQKPDVIFCLGWSQLLDNDILSYATKGCVGFHPAKLPYNRGRHPLIWALVLGLKETASTFFIMNDKADEGNIISQETIDITYEDDATTLYDKVMEKALIQLEQIVYNFEDDNIKIIKSNDIGNIWRKRGKEDGRIDFRMSSRTIYNLVRALTKPYVGAHIEYNNVDYKVWKVREIITDEYRNIEPGKVIDVLQNGNIVIKTADNLVEILESDKIDIHIGEYL